ncbi:hypothetical protein SAMN05444397_108131 [Flavobacterium aquidurense]|uniref:DUF1444 domain-containing protein n=1 Tax=Flavobacterium frigidimaris TaxID=262320 RepID=A0ABX4BQ18_FLAFR|nr:hypothetical protein [Flavobacterium frigidimaris]OXA78842.1 hypothetical protein B0A65_11645 [Flavobacterium frigidimaris]SDZ52486.1 hypothetical protein SAMN05444397_108131 [Flavobacterium aquidurense]
MSNSFKSNSKEDVVFNTFKIQLENKGLTIDFIDKDGFILINVEESELKVSLENVRRNYERDNDESYITDLVNTIVSHSSKKEDWENIKDKIYVQFFPNDFEFENLIYEKVTDEFSKVFMVNTNNNFSFISEDDLIDWNLDLEELKNQVDLNLDTFSDKVKIEIEDVENHKLGMIDIEEVWLKSACLFSSKIKYLVQGNIGFPFYAVIPVRDFCYIFGEQDFEYFSERLGSVIVEEYEKSGYPITTEILKFTENGVQAMGKY